MKHKAIERVIGALRREPEPEVFGPEEVGVEWDAHAKEDPTRQSK